MTYREIASGAFYAGFGIVWCVAMLKILFGLSPPIFQTVSDWIVLIFGTMVILGTLFGDSEPPMRDRYV